VLNHSGIPLDVVHNVKDERLRLPIVNQMWCQDKKSVQWREEDLVDQLSLCLTTLGTGVTPLQIAHFPESDGLPGGKIGL
jgi:hypothetical protein